MIAYVLSFTILVKMMIPSSATLIFIILTIAINIFTDDHNKQTPY